MLAAWYERNGPAVEVLQCGEFPDTQLAAGEVRVKLAFSPRQNGSRKSPA